ncbi:hypothetical protein QBC35DRAFT_140041 [Podospora australis]|uniref:Uncharacterized protein n=1 Tax=Podospora australis TaxID=1536484 RepID=A0AAN7ADS5_9PEZI|nr:hypothetical protein QBC35DRAFT_140041 [Podospora australis]
MSRDTRDYKNPLTEHVEVHDHDLRDGSMGDAAQGGETREEMERNKPTQPVDEASRPSHVLGGEKNTPAPTDVHKVSQMGGSQEGLAKSGRESRGIGGLEGEGTGPEGILSERID